MWKIEKIISKGDYNYVVLPGHPNSTKNGYVLEHRVVVENHLGRLLNPDEVVHHKNGIKKDNRLENLEVLDSKEHSRHHGLKHGRVMVTLKCPNCGKLFSIRKGQSFLQKKNKYTCCSKQCRGKFSRREQLFGLTLEMQTAISGNLVREFISHDNPEQTLDKGMRRGHTPST